MRKLICKLYESIALTIGFMGFVVCMCEAEKIEQQMKLYIVGLGCIVLAYFLLCVEMGLKKEKDNE